MFVSFLHTPSYPSIPDTPAATKQIFLWEEEDVYVATDDSDDGDTDFSDHDELLNVRIINNFLSDIMLCVKGFVVVLCGLLWVFCFVTL